LKLLVFKAIAMTFAFIAANAIEILKIIWLPTALFVGVFGVLLPNYGQALIAPSTLGTDATPEQVGEAFATVVPAMLVMGLISAAYYLVVFAGVLKLVIHGEKPKLPFYLGFGGDELRLLGTWVLYLLIFIGAYFVVGLVAAMVGGAALAIAGAGPFIVIAVACIALVAFLWLNLRLSLATPAAVGQRTIGIGPSWNASKGNVFRLFAYWLVWAVIFAVVEFALILALMPGFFAAYGQIITASAAGDLAGAEAASQSLNEAMALMYDGSPMSVARLGGATLIGSLLFALWAVAGGVAWRLMTDDRPEKHFE
jgi:hypothetical protein